MYRGCQKAVTYRTRGTFDACSVGLHFDKCKVARRGACIWSWKGWKNMLNPLKWLVKKWVPANSEHKSMSFMVRSRKTILKIPTTFWSSQIQSQKYYNTKLEGKTSLLSFKIRPDLFQISLSLFLSLLCRIGKVHLKDSPSLSTFPFFLEEMQCDRGREQPPFATLQDWHSGHQRKAGGWGSADIHFPSGNFGDAAQETK